MIKLVLFLPVIGIMLGFGLEMPFDEVVRGLKRTGLLARGVVMSIVLVPAIAVLCVELFGLSGVPAAALILVSAAAGPLMIPIPVSAAKGDLVYAFELELVIGLVSVVSAPVTTNWLASAGALHALDASVPVASTIGNLMFLVFLPLLMGIVIHEEWPERAPRIARWVHIVAIAMIALALLLALIPLGRSVPRSGFGLGWRGALAAAVSGLASAGLGYVLGGHEIGTRKTLALSAQGRNMGLALALVTSAAPGRPLLLAAVFAVWFVRTLFNALLAGAVFKQLGSHGESPRPQPPPKADLRSRPA
jgi:BASS family bile acid:Na+ symporter